MSFSDIYQKGPFRFSVEVFPPKTEKGLSNLLQELQKLKAIDPAYISVTYGAMGSTRDLTKDLATQVFEQTRVPTAFHFTCVGGTREEIKSYVTAMHKQGLNLVVALRGDPPQNETEFQPPKDGFAYANELVEYLKSIDDFSIAVAGYPEKHVQAPDLETDIQNLKRKIDAGASVIITQLFYDNQDFYAWSKRVREVGIHVPIIAGIMPIASLKQIQRITQMCGAKLPTDLLSQLEACDDDADKMRQVGIEHATKQCRDLIQNGVQGIHFYCLNKAESTLKIVEACQDLV